MDQTNEEIGYILPISHLSYSALRLYCANPQQFKKNYIEARWDRLKESMVALVGTGFHKVMECYHAGMSLEASLQEGYKTINDVPAEKLNFEVKKRENLLAELAQAVRFYLETPFDFGTVLETESNYTVDLFLGGELMPLPLKAKSDVIFEKDGNLGIGDWKVVTSFTNPEKVTQTYVVQAMFNYYVAKQVYKRDPKNMVFIEVKKSANNDKSIPQVNIITINYSDHPEYQVYFEKLYKGFIIQMLNQNLQYLPNFGDPFTGEESWDEFVQEPTVDFGIGSQVAAKVKGSSSTSVTSRNSSLSAKQTLPEPSKDDTPESGIVSKFGEFGIPVTFVQKYPGPSVTLYTFKPSRGVTMNKIRQYEDDLMIALGANSVRIIAPIAGTQTIGVEIDNQNREVAWFKSSEKGSKNEIIVPVGVDVYGKTQCVDLVKAPHLLVAGTTGSGKSVFLNVLLKSIGSNCKTVLIDPKGNEFNGITEISEIYITLEKLILEMKERYTLFRAAEAKNLEQYNERNGKRMKRIVVIVDEMADIFLSREKIATATPTKQEKSMVIDIDEDRAGKVIKSQIIRLAQKSRAAGIHLVLATQRPSVDVVDGILKANLPTRIAFSTVTEVDSKVILDQPGAERLLGSGDLLLMKPGNKNLIRLQGFYTE